MILMRLMKKRSVKKEKNAKNQLGDEVKSISALVFMTMGFFMV